MITSSKSEANRFQNFTKCRKISVNFYRPISVKIIPAMKIVLKHYAQFQMNFWWLSLLAEQESGSKIGHNWRDLYDQTNLEVLQGDRPLLLAF